MIVDTLENLEKYVSLNPLFAEVVKFLKENDLNELEDGKHSIVGNDLFVNITTAHGKTVDEAVFETHKNMLDIQIPLDNEETYGYLPLAKLPEAEYNAEKDVTKYPGAVASAYVTCLVNLLFSLLRMGISHASVQAISTRLSSKSRHKLKINQSLRRNLLLADFFLYS